MRSGGWKFNGLFYHFDEEKKESDKVQRDPISQVKLSRVLNQYQKS